MTESASVVSINTPMHNKPGTVGRLMPGMLAKLEPVPGVDEGGRLMIAGPNVMAGYLRAAQPGVLQPLEDSWHDTGDIVTIDAEGFITIKGRAKRFAKIGGEMVSLAAVEELAAQLWPGELSAAATVKDLRKGERVLLFTQAQGADRTTFAAFAKRQGAQDLTIPSEVITVDAVPVLGSGKVDFSAVNVMANAIAAPMAA